MKWQTENKIFLNKVTKSLQNNVYLINKEKSQQSEFDLDETLKNSQR